MPWTETSVMNERMKFVVRLEEGERMTDLCKEFEISRTTGHKLWKRYLERGFDGLFDESRAPVTCPHKTEDFIIELILKLKEKHKTWGAQKLREYLMRKYSNHNFPSVTTFHNILLQNNLVKKRKRKRFKAKGTNLNPANNPNDLWCVDYKGEFKLKNKKYCYPFTLTDFSSRFLVNITCMESTKTYGTMAVMEEVFREFGLPKAIRSDNGIPFGCPSALLGMSELSVWWLRLGIDIERIRPGHPEENGRHERMHRTLKQEIQTQIKSTILSQQEVMDKFREVYNKERPHMGINNQVPMDLYKKPERKMPQNLPEVIYPKADKEQYLTSRGKLYYGGKEISISQSFKKQKVGIYRVDDNILKLKFMDLVLGHIDDKSLEFSAMREFIKEEV